MELKAARSLATVAYEKRVLVSYYDIMRTMARSPIYDRTSNTFVQRSQGICSIAFPLEMRIFFNAEKSRYQQYLISAGRKWERTGRYTNTKSDGS